MSIAETLAKKAAELKANPNAAPLTVEEQLESNKQAEEAKQSLRDLHTPPKGAYVAHRIPRLILKNGKVVLPTYGYYVAQSEEEEDMLAYYDSLNMGLVTLVE